ncbi:MAG: hypothetical protein V3V95_02845 [Thermodesulfobacteriota bacterium]
MVLDKRWKEFLSLGTPATYRILVLGELDQSWSDRLAGMAISVDAHEEVGRVSTLLGLLKDQAELSGVLNSLYELHLPLLSVKVLNNDEDI